MDLKTVISQGNSCLEQRENIPGAPLWLMGKVAVFDSTESFSLLQNTIDYLACKGQLGKPFTDDEKEFMKEIFEALWWGGKYHGFEEAAALANHYVNGDGKALMIDARVYQESVIVSDTMTALKAYIRDQEKKKQPIASLRSGDPGFMRSQYGLALTQGRRSALKQGYILSDGALLTEQSNQRLKNADHRFHLQVATTKGGQQIFMSRWKVESTYDFEPFEKGYVTDIPLTKDFVLKLPDGLSHYLTKIDVAKEFNYGAQWNETWK